MRWSSIQMAVLTAPAIRTGQHRLDHFALTVRQLVVALVLVYTFGFPPSCHMPRATAQEIGNIIPLPDMPFVIPAAHIFPTYLSQHVLTQRVDNQRTGTIHAAGLDQGSFAAGRFRLLQSLNVDAPVTAQPLFVSSLNPPTGTVIVATANNTI